MNQIERKLVVADPSGIGLFGLAMVTLVASSQKLGWTEGVSFIAPWAIFLGGIAQLYASVLDSKKNNVFGTTAFGAFGLFWLGIAMSWLISLGLFGEGMKTNADASQLGFVFIGYLIFSIFMTIGSLETNKVLFFIFLAIDFLFIGLSISTLLHVEAAHTLAAYSEFIISMLSFYGCAGNVLNRHFGKEFLPLGKPFGIIK